ncbi:MAG: hypothetical protein HY695_14425 [Deltaproteobacteria bacterium]|nr:hypothetical protein [Deltaproteobacteria bacterium]
MKKDKEKGTEPFPPSIRSVAGRATAQQIAGGPAIGGLNQLLAKVSTYCVGPNS